VKTLQSRESAFAAAHEEADIEGIPMAVWEERREKEGRFYHVGSVSEGVPEEWSMAWRVEPMLDGEET
jgi:hypothetical protein